MVGIPTFEFCGDSLGQCRSVVQIR